MARGFDWLIVGAGFTGAVFAERIASQLGRRVLLIDKRDHIGGNAYDHLDAAGVLVHKYGPHLFHTNSQMVWDYLSQFTQWNPYTHRVRAVIDGRQIPIPFSLISLRMMFPPAEAAKLEAELLARFGLGATMPVLKMREECTGDLRRLAEFVYDRVLRGYTLKQWGIPPESLAPSVTARVPIVVDYDDRYFHDTYQAMPRHGFTRLFQNLLNHPNIEVALNTDYRDIMGDTSFDRMVYTGPIDAFFDYAHGPLPYRSLRFEMKTYDQPLVQDVASVNYPNDHAYTRITEFKHATGQRCGKTTTACEFAQVHVPGENEPFYPIPRDANRLLMERYRAEAKKLNGSVIFSGRLADYQYYNMDQVVARALTVFEQEIAADATRVRRTGDVQPTTVAA